MTGDDLGRIDQAMIGLRHLWSGPLHLDDRELGRVEMSTVWIVNALADAAQQQDHDGMSIRDLASTLGVAHSTASRLSDRAVSAGAVSRGPDAHDARLSVIALTDRGRTLARTATQFRTAYLAHVTRTWTDEERSSFADLLTRFTGAVVATPPHHLEEAT